jgi:hypothetical protein
MFAIVVSGGLGGGLEASYKGIIAQLERTRCAYAGSIRVLRMKKLIIVERRGVSPVLLLKKRE